MIFVADASVAVKWFVREDEHASAVGLLAPGSSIIAPDLIFSETANVFWKKLRKGEVTFEQAERACEALPDYISTIVPARAVIQDAFGLAQRLDHPVYDCVYVMCAERAAVRLVTADRRFVEVLRRRGLGHHVQLLGEANSANERPKPRSD